MTNIAVFVLHGDAQVGSRAIRHWLGCCSEQRRRILGLSTVRLLGRFVGAVVSFLRAATICSLAER